MKKLPKSKIDGLKTMYLYAETEGERNNAKRILQRNGIRLPESGWWPIDLYKVKPEKKMKSIKLSDLFSEFSDLVNESEFNASFDTTLDQKKQKKNYFDNTDTVESFWLYILLFIILIICCL